MNVSFFLPEEYLPNYDWQKVWDQEGILTMEEGGFVATIQSWIFQTWALLRKAGVPCDLVTKMPTEGIVIALSSSLSHLHTTSEKLFFVDIMADAYPFSKAHLHLSQSKAMAPWLAPSLFVPHWPQPNLMPRDPSRRFRFENISFFGYNNNLAEELHSPEWKAQLRRQLGLYLECPPSPHWHDYRTTDAVIAIRDFSKSRHFHKPATKLYNAWMAGVPFIGGRDAAYAADGSPGNNYLMATSPEEVLEQLHHLKEDPSFRQQLVSNGARVASSFTQEATVQRWKKLITTTLPERALAWEKKSPTQRSLFWALQKGSCFLDSCFRKGNTPDDIKKVMLELKN